MRGGALLVHRLLYGDDEMVYFGLLWSTLVYFGLLWPTLVYFGIDLRVEYPRMLEIMSSHDDLSQWPSRRWSARPIVCPSPQVVWWRNLWLAVAQT